jgi:hypothetical protein
MHINTTTENPYLASMDIILPSQSLKILPESIIEIQQKLYHTITKINYPVRIHSAQTCRCKRIQNKLDALKIKKGQKIIYIIEKIWNDDDFKDFPNYIYIMDNADNTRNDKFLEANRVLNLLFNDLTNSRKYVVDYFKKYQWSKKTSIRARNIVRNMMTVCFCNNNLMLNDMTCNAGFILIGTKNHMETISHSFNKYVHKTEFSKICMVKIENITNLEKENIGHNIDVFQKSTEIKLLDPSLYTLVGIQSNNYLSDPQIMTYSFPFGKREWFGDAIENSFECAKRELYEEFNLQFSDKIWTYSNSVKGPQYIHYPGFKLYFLYLPEETTIWYHRRSDTICLDIL